MTSAPAPDGASRPPSPPLAKMNVADGVLVAVGFALFLWLFSVLLSHAGALWRDEVGSAWLAQRTTWRWMLGLVREDSFPPLFNTCLRLWMMLGDTSDGWLQSWGYITAFALAPALWWSTRSNSGALPLLGIAMVYFNPTMFYWGHSVRAYGIAAVLIVLFFGAIWRLLERPSQRAFVLASLIAILNAQASYQNAPLILAISLAAATVAAMRRQWMGIGLVLTPGFLSAVSLLIHIKAILYVQEWNIMIRQTFGVGWIVERMAEALGSAGVVYAWLWLALFVALGVFAARLWTRGGRGGFERPEVRAAVFSFITVALTVVLVFAFVLHVGYPTQEWYYVPFMCLVATALEFGFSPLSAEVRFRVARIALVLGVVAGSVSTIWKRAHVRRTNIDLIAAKMRTESTPRDLIIVRPFYCGMAFQYYYNGSTPWMTIPPIEWPELHNCYDTVRQYVKVNEPMGSTIERIAATLRGGGRVWFVGGIQFLQPNQRPPASPPAPHPQFGWSDEFYSQIWALQVGYFLQNHVTTASVVEVPVNQPVQKFENLPLVQVSGWRE